MESFPTFLKITCLHSRKSYLDIICPNAHENLTKSEISWSQFEHCLESLVRGGRGRGRCGDAKTIIYLKNRLMKHKNNNTSVNMIKEVIKIYYNMIT